MNYRIKRANSDFSINADWNKKAWKEISEISIAETMGKAPFFSPKSTVKLCYTETNLYVIFKVVDKYVIAVAENNFDPVFEDSCVEFFFTPNNQKPSSYFNLETNCGGTVLFGFREKAGTKSQRISKSDIFALQIATTLPKIIKTEIKEEITWIIEYKLPFELLKKYNSFGSVESKTEWKANFYKCADKSSNPHWLTWTKIDYPEPNFHLPEFFETLVFE